MRVFYFIKMAEGKKSVLLYCDLIHTIEKMDNETAGLFFKHYLRYINDKNPKTDNLIVDISFESVKQNLKRDLQKWEKRSENSRLNGLKGGRPKTQITQSVNLKPKEPVTDTVNVNVIKKQKDSSLLFEFQQTKLRSCKTNAAMQEFGRLTFEDKKMAIDYAPIFLKEYPKELQAKKAENYLRDMEWHNVESKTKITYE